MDLDPLGGLSLDLNPLGGEMRPTHENGVRITYRSLGHEQLTVSTAAVALASLPADRDRIRRVAIRNLSQPICWTDDGVDPTGTTGWYQYKDEIFVADSDFEQLRFIRASDATADADLRVIYYG